MSTPEFDDLKAAVTAENTVADSLVTLLNGIAAQLAALVAAGTINPADITAVATQIKTETASMVAAVTANTPTPVTPPAPASGPTPAAPAVRRPF